MTHQNNPAAVCDPLAHFGRRTLLGWAGGGLMMSSIARSLALADEIGSTDRSRPKNVILLWLEGGASQLETFDPHAGTKIGGDTRAIETSVSGLQISEFLPQLAEQMHQCSLVRSVTGKEGDHARALYNTKTGFRPDPTLQHPSVGSILCSEDQRGSDIPRHISILPGSAPARGGYLGAAYDAFNMGDPERAVPDVRARTGDDRFAKRISDLSSVVEQEFRRGRLAKMESQRTLHQSATDSALRMMSSDQLDAFDVSDESKATREAFGDTAFGRGCLAASRLIEVGARCIEVTLSGWDSHVANHSLHRSASEVLDPALASLLTRLQDRDLLDSTLVVCGGEFGRTPKINAAEGRDHWTHGFSVLLAGLGLRRGAVYGATSPSPKLDPNKPLADIENPVTIEDIHATILTAIGINPTDEIDTPVGRPMKRSEGTPIVDILSA